MDLRKIAAAALATAACALAADAPRTILAIGAHCGDMEITTGAVLAAHRARGGRIVLLHLTLGEGGNPKLTPQAYGEQKRREAEAAARVLGAEVRFGPYHDGSLPNTEETRRYVAGVIAEVKPDYVFTHWRNSMHRDHSTTHAVVVDAILLASLAGAHVRGVYYAENWEDKEGFQPYVYMDASASLEKWKEAASQYQLYRGGVVSYPYLEYYEALARVRGADAGKKYAVAFEIESYNKKRIVDALP
jgi:N-acetylglucosamine malate deacetylase 1